jgi:hypothetical protein
MRATAPTSLGSLGPPVAAAPSGMAGAQRTIAHLTVRELLEVLGAPSPDMKVSDLTLRQLLQVMAAAQP